MDILEIRQTFLAGNYYLTRHARARMEEKNISEYDVIQAVLNGEIIEEYPEHYQGPCCLIYGTSSNEEPIHVVASTGSPAWVITVYEPDPREWVDSRTRR